jgi:hypothetical protein
MRPRPGARPFDLVAEETLAPLVGFAWEARTGIGPIRMRILDVYRRGEGWMTGRVLGVIPTLDARGADITRSARGRLAGESLFVPPALLPGPGVRWSPVDAERASVRFEIDGEAFEPTLRFDDGRLQEIIMERWGDVGRPDFGLTPYGFSTGGETEFDGIRIPTRFRGGWWYGSDRYDPEQASTFEILEASFR